MKYLLLLLLFSGSVFADTATITFTPPTEREDGTLLPANEIGGYNVFVNGVINETSPLLPTATGFTLDLPSGAHTVTVTTMDTDGRESLFSIPVAADVPFDPKAPGGVAVIITINVK